MTKLIYIDTNVYLDLLDNRHSGYMPMGEIALNIINRAIKCEFHIIVSDVLLRELERFAPQENVKRLFASLTAAHKISFEFAENCDKLKAGFFDISIPFYDRLHFAIAERCGAEYLVTSDKHFDKLKNNVKVIRPNLL